VFKAFKESIVQDFEKSLENLDDDTRLNKTQDFMKQLLEQYATTEMKSRVRDVQKHLLLSLNDFGADILIPQAPPFENVEKQAKDFGEFNRTDIKLPYYDGSYDMNFASMNDQLWTEDVRQYVEDVMQNKYIDVHMRVSGAGKTAKILAVGTQIHMVYVVASSPIDYISGKDESYMTLLSILGNSSRVHQILDVRHEVRLFLLARLLHLYLLLQQNITPIDFLKMQFNGQKKYILEIYALVRSLYSMYTEADILSLSAVALLQIRQKTKKIGLAIDEASVAAKQFPYLLSEYGKIRPLLTILTEEVMKLDIHYRTFAGTAMTLLKVRSITSSIGKQGILLPILRINSVHGRLEYSAITFTNSTSLDTVQDVERFVRLHVNLDSCDDASLSELTRLRGRRRIAALLIQKLSQKHVGSNKSEILKNCINQVYSGYVNYLADNIQTKCREDIGVCSVVQDLIVFSELSHSDHYSTNIDILEVGITETSAVKKESEIVEYPKFTMDFNDNFKQHVKPTSKTNKRQREEDEDEQQNNPKRARIEYTLNKITEPVVFDACALMGNRMNWNKESLILQHALQLFATATNTFGTKCSENDKLFEQLVFANLAKDYPEKENAPSIAATPFIAADDQMKKREWMNAPFIVKRFGTSEQLFQQPFDEILESIASSLTDCENETERDNILSMYTNIIFMSPNEAHPYGFYLAWYQDKLYLMLFSCKCKTSKLDLSKSHASTLVDRLYMKNYVNDVPTKTEMSKKFRKLFKLDKGDDCLIRGVLRIHIHIAPSFKLVKNDPEPIDNVKIDMESIDIGWEKLNTLITDERSLSILTRLLST
jgi:hypothetical protein